MSAKVVDYTNPCRMGGVFLQCERSFYGVRGSFYSAGLLFFAV